MVAPVVVVMPVALVVPAASGAGVGCPAACEQAEVSKRQAASEQARPVLAHGFVT